MTAIGDFTGEIEINIAGNSQSSSVLPMLETHISAAQNSKYINKVKVPIVRLDEVASKYLGNSKNYFIKIDTQGFEWQVLNGAPEVLFKAKRIMCELSLVPLYQGQKLWMELMDRLNSEGFTLWTIQGGFTESRNGRTLQVDATFFRLGK
jgi:hypothetical protein